MGKTTTYVGLDVHKGYDSGRVGGDGHPGRGAGVWEDHPYVSRAGMTLTTKLASRHGELRFCYEAGPCGYGIQRQLAGLGHECVVVAPSLIPRKPGERVKTDRRDAGKLATLHRAGELTPVWVPDQAHEAMRDLVRARQAAVRSLRQARQQLVRFPASGMAITASDLPGRRRTSALVVRPQVRPTCLLYSVGRCRRSCRSGNRATQPAGGARSKPPCLEWSLVAVVQALPGALRGIRLVAAAATLVAEDW